MQHIPINNKQIRAKVIKQYLGNKRCFCFSCGNASRALKKEGVNVIEITKDSKLTTNGYISPLDSDNYFNCFNATSGCLPIYMIRNIASTITGLLPHEIFTNKIPIYIPTGSGETTFAFSFIFPIKRLIAVTAKHIPAIQHTTCSELYDFIDYNIKKITLSKLDLNKEGYFINTGIDPKELYGKKN